jgi:tetratricopeptide (TPR) repeat protein
VSQIPAPEGTGDLGPIDGGGRSAVHAARPALGARGRATLCAALGVALWGCGSPGPDAARSRAQIATDTGDWQGAAERWYAIYEREGVTDPQPCAETARALIGLGDAEGAARFAELGLRDHPRCVELFEVQAEALVAQGFLRAAEGWYERALSIDPDRAPSLRGLAGQRIALGMEASAVRPLERLVELGQADAESWRMLAFARQTAGDPLGAFDAWSEAFERGAGGQADLVRAAGLCLRPEVEAARPAALDTSRAWLARAIDVDPQCTPAHFQLGVLLERAGDRAGAERAYLRAVETDPANLTALTNLAVLYAELGQVERTRAMVELALDLEPDDGRRAALVRLLQESEERSARRGAAPVAPGAQEPGAQER